MSNSDEKRKHTSDDIIKAKPNFPASAPPVFRDPSVSIITKKLLETQYKNAVNAIKALQLYVTPPRIFIRQVGYRHEETQFTPIHLSSFRELCEGNEISRIQTEATEGDYDVSTALPSTPPQKSKKVKLFDIKTELTNYVDIDFLLYNNEHIIKYYDDEHLHKSLNIYKYVASSKLKRVCNELKAKWETFCDVVEIKISNEEYFERIPKDSKLMFEGGCSATRTALLCLVPFLLPVYIHEQMNKVEYSCGFVFRVKKKEIGVIQKELIKEAEEHFLETGIVTDGKKRVESSMSLTDDSSGFRDSRKLKTSGRIEGNEVVDVEMEASYREVMKRADQTSTV